MEPRGHHASASGWREVWWRRRVAAAALIRDGLRFNRRRRPRRVYFGVDQRYYRATKGARETEMVLLLRRHEKLRVLVSRSRLKISEKNERWVFRRLGV